MNFLKKIVKIIKYNLKNLNITTINFDFILNFNILKKNKR